MSTIRVRVRVRVGVRVMVRFRRGDLFPHTHACKVRLSGMRFSEGGQRPVSRASES